MPIISSTLTKTKLQGNLLKLRPIHVKDKMSVQCEGKLTWLLRGLINTEIVFYPPPLIHSFSSQLGSPQYCIVGGAERSGRSRQSPEVTFEVLT